DQIVSDRPAVGVLPHFARDPQPRELLRAPAGVPLARLAEGVLGERPGDLRESLGRIVEDPAPEEHVVVLRPSRSCSLRAAQVRLEPPAADVQMRVLLILLAAENIAARRPDAA